MFTEGKANSTSFSKGRFLTYCFLQQDSVAILVHVPELRRYTDDAKLTMEEYAWSIATSYASSKHPGVKTLALGIKGALNYSSIITGTVNDKEPLKGIGVRHPTASTEPLWPYFLSSKNQSEQGADGNPH